MKEDTFVGKLPKTVKLDHICTGKGGRVTHALGHTIKSDGTLTGLSVLWDSDGKSFIRRYADANDIQNEIKILNQAKEDVVFLNGWKYLRDKQFDVIS